MVLALVARGGFFLLVKWLCAPREMCIRDRFAWIPFTLFYLLRHGERSDFWRVCLCLFAGMTIALSCYVLLPTGLALRPYRVYGSDIFARLVRMLYAVDSSKNVCPSIHVLNTVTLMIGYRRSLSLIHI